MIKFIFLLIFIQGVVLSAMLDSVEVKGVKVPFIFEKDSSLPIVSMELIFKNSGSIEDNNSYGLSAFTSSMLNEGTKTLGSVGFAKKLEDNAIDLRASRGLETFAINLSSLKEKFGDGVGYLSQLLNEPNFTEDSFNKVKLLKLSVLDKKENDFDYQAQVALKELLFKGTPNEKPVIGTKESINSFKLSDIESFYKKHIVLSRAVVVIGGDLSIDKAKAYAKEVLDVLDVGKYEPLKKFKPLDISKTVYVKKDTKQAYVYFGAPFDMDVKDSDSYKAKVAAFILGSGGFGSRMMEEIRVKRGLAYSAYSRVALNKSFSAFKGYLQTKLESQEEAVKLVKEVVKNFTEHGVTKDELEQAKRFIIGSEPLRNERLSQRLDRTFNEYYKGFEIGHTKKELELIKNLQLVDLNKFIKKHMEINKLSFAIVTK